MKKILVEKISITLNSFFQRFFFLSSHLNMSEQNRKNSGAIIHGLGATSIMWIVPLPREEGFICPQREHVPWFLKKSANLWELPTKFFLFCFALRALLLSTAQLWPVLLFLSRGTQVLLVLLASIPDTVSIRLFVVLKGCSPHCLPGKLHLKLVCTEGEQVKAAVLTLLQLWSKPLAPSFLGFLPCCCCRMRVAL